jgi:hypothetical protein
VPDILPALATVAPVPDDDASELDPPPPQADRAAAIEAHKVNFKNPELRLFFNFFLVESGS